jgi:ribosomal-protein-alanine N-acetyltransferase
MVPADLPAVLEVEARAYGTGFAPGAFAHELERNTVARYVVLETGEGVVVGFAGLWLQFDEAHVVTCAVDPALQRSGYGSLLVYALIAIAEANGLADATLEVRVSNTAARSLYARFGFWEVGERRRYYADNGEDAVIMTTDSFDSTAFQAILERRAAELDDRIPGWRALFEGLAATDAR